MKPICCIAALLLCVCPSVGAQSHSWCENSFPVLESPDNLPARLANFSFMSADESSFGRMKLFNTKDKSIEYLLIVVELLDERKDHLLSIVFYNRNLKKEPPFDFEYTPWLEANGGNYIEPIKPMAEAEVQAPSPVIALKCPTTAEVTVFDLAYSDGEIFQYASPTFNAEALISRAPLSNLKALQKWQPVSVSGSIDVNSGGGGTLADLSVNEPELRDWFVKQINQWKFSPRIVAGRKTSDILWFAFTIGKSPLDPIPFTNLREKGTRFALSLSVDPILKKQLLVGGFPVSGGRKR